MYYVLCQQGTEGSVHGIGAWGEKPDNVSRDKPPPPLSPHCPVLTVLPPIPLSSLLWPGKAWAPSPMSQISPCALIFPSLFPQVPLLALCRASTLSSRLISPACLSFRPLEISPSFPKPDRNTSHLSCVSAVLPPFPRQTLRLLVSITLLA
jgi:hypothetical protein